MLFLKIYNYIILWVRKLLMRNMHVKLILEIRHGRNKLFLIYIVMGLRVAISRFLCKSTFFMTNTDILSNFLNFFEFLGCLARKRYFYIKTLKLQLLGP